MASCYNVKAFIAFFFKHFIAVNDNTITLNVIYSKLLMLGIWDLWVYVQEPYLIILTLFSPLQAAWNLGLLGSCSMGTFWNPWDYCTKPCISTCTHKEPEAVINKQFSTQISFEICPTFLYIFSSHTVMHLRCYLMFSRMDGYI